MDINKFQTIILAMLLILFMFSTNTFGYDFEVNTGTIFSFPDEIVNVIQAHKYYNNNYYCIGVRYTKNNNYYVIFLKKTQNLKMYIESPTSFHSSENVDRYELHFDSNYNLIYESTEFSENTFFDSFKNFGNLCYSNILFLGYGDYYKNNNEIFFQFPPQVVITKIAKVEEITKTMSQVMKVIIPVGLAILLTVLVISLVRWVILRMVL